jgi:hypothetical protein
VLGQQPGMYKLYTQLFCVFPVADPSSHDAVVSSSCGYVEHFWGQDISLNT